MSHSEPLTLDGLHKADGSVYAAGLWARGMRSPVCMCTAEPEALETDTVGKEPRMKSAASLIASMRMWLPGPPETDPAARDTPQVPRLRRVQGTTAKTSSPKPYSRHSDGCRGLPRRTLRPETRLSAAHSQGLGHDGQYSVP